MIKRLLCKLFPNIIQEIIDEANIIYQYGSMEAYHKACDEHVKMAEEENEYHRRIYEEEHQYDK